MKYGEKDADRNADKSSSSRRTWIEIFSRRISASISIVVLLAEDVD